MAKKPKSTVRFGNRDGKVVQTRKGKGIVNLILKATGR